EDVPLPLEVGIADALRNQGGAGRGRQPRAELLKPLVALVVGVTEHGARAAHLLVDLAADAAVEIGGHAALGPTDQHPAVAAHTVIDGLGAGVRALGGE